MQHSNASRILWEFLEFVPAVACVVISAGVFVIHAFFHKSVLFPGVYFQTFLLSPYAAIYTCLILIFAFRRPNTRLVKACEIAVGVLCLIPLLGYTEINMLAELRGGWAGR